MSKKLIIEKAFNAIQALQEGSITIEEANKISEDNRNSLNELKKQNAQKAKELRLIKQAKTNNFTKEVQKAINDIKLYVTKSAEHIIKIGDVLNSITDKLKRGTKGKFYTAIGMTQRTAQRYKKIAANPEIQKLKNEGNLANLNLTQMLTIIGEKQEASNNTEIDFTKVAQGIYTRYKEPAQLEALIEALTKLLDKSKSA